MQKKIIRKSPLTLIEVCIALGLMSIIVYTLFSSLIQTVRVARSLEQIKTSALTTSFFYNHLQHIFSRAVPNTIKFEPNDNDSISKVEFTFENGLDKALIYSGLREASLMLEKNNDLLLTIFSKNKENAWNEVLLSGVKEFSITPNLPFFLTVNITFLTDSKKEFVFFFSDRPQGSEAFGI